MCYYVNDVYWMVIDCGIVKFCVYLLIKDGMVDGELVLRSCEWVVKKC